MSPAHFLDDLPQRLRAWATEFGFSDAGIAHLELDEDVKHLQNWLDAGMHGEMHYMNRHRDLRRDPARLRPGTLAVISLRFDYRPPAAPAEAVLADGRQAYIARYALGRDYHRVLRARLLRLGRRLAQEVGPHGYRVLVDSAPALEKALARNAGLGWIGKNTLLLNRQGGSWFFLGEIYTDLPLPPAPATPTRAHCGSCTACLDVCPTGAFLGPHRLDARRCISYLTIEHRGSIPEALRPLMGNRVFGCDDCQLVCPWNRYARLTTEADFAPRHGLDNAQLVDLFAWTEAEWQRRTEGMALRRAGYEGWLRNLAVALGNAPYTPHICAALEARRDDPSALVREHVTWALARQAQRAQAAAGLPS